MQTAFKEFFSPSSPVFPEDEGKSRLAQYLTAIVKTSLPALLIFAVLRISQGIPPLHGSNLTLAALAFAMVIVWILMKSGAVRLAGYMTVGAVWIGSTMLAVGGSGIRGTGFVSYLVVMLLAGLLLGVRAATGVAILSVLSGFSLAAMEATGAIKFTPDEPWIVAIEFSFIFLISIIIIRLTINSLETTLNVSRVNARQLKYNNLELTKLRDALELRIQERTASLEKRASQIQTVSNLAREIAAVQDVDTLLPDITKMVSEQFGFYHTGIFLLDETGEFAVLRATNSEGGRRMLARGHRLYRDSNSVVGYATSSGEPRIALDVGTDSVYFNNPDLPETRSEMTLPLRVRGRIIGALDVQSTQKNAFVQEDISILSTLADQIAIAIENARLFAEAQKALLEAQETYEKYVSQSWNTFAKQVRNAGYVFDGKQVFPLDAQFKREQNRSVRQTGELSLEKPASTVAVPIKVRGQIIGYLDIRSKKGERSWTRDEITLLEAAAERAALALENARLVESAQRRAARERAIGDISTKIGAVNSFEYILQTAVEELGRKIGGATEVTLEINGNDEQARHK